MNIEETTGYLRTNRLFVPMFNPACTFVIEGKALENAEIDRIDLKEYADAIFSYITELQTQNAHIRRTFKEIAANDFNIHYHRDAKAEILEEFFPELTNKLPYYAGGKIK